MLCRIISVISSKSISSIFVDFFINFWESRFACESLPHCVVEFVVKHPVELFLAAECISVEHLEAIAFLHEILNGSCGLHWMEVINVGYSVNSNINVHFFLLLGVNHSRIVGEIERTEPEGINLNTFVEKFNALLHCAGWNQEILDDVVIFVQFLHSFRLGKLKQGHLDWHHPSQEVPEEDIIAKGYNVLQFPKQGSRVTVVVIHNRDILHAVFASFQDLLNMLEKPRLVPLSDLINFSSFHFRILHHYPCHYNRLVQGVLQALDKVIRFVLGLAVESLHNLI